MLDVCGKSLVRYDSSLMTYNKYIFVIFMTQDETISQIHQELCDLQSHYQSQLADRDQQLAQKDQELEQIKLVSHERPSQGLPGSRETSGVAQQLDFGAGGCGFGGQERLKELAAQVEDLTYQLSTTREELEAALERAGHAEVRRSLAIYNYICMYILYLMYVNAMVHVHVCVFPFASYYYRGRVSYREEGALGLSTL